MACGQDNRFTLYDLQCTIMGLCDERHFLAAGVVSREKSEN